MSPSLTNGNIVSMTPGARMMLGIAIGDAFGARFENQVRESVTLDGEERTYHTRNQYTDDTQMTVAVSELLISGLALTGSNLADALIGAYRRDPRSGYSEVTRGMLELSANGAEFLRCLPDDEIAKRRSDGSAMRAIPIGLLPDLNDVIRFASVSSAISHGHPDAIAATVGVALLAHDRYYTGRPFSKSLKEIIGLIPNLTSSTEAYFNQVLAGWNPEIILEEYENYGVPYTESRIFFGAVIAILARFGEDPYRALLEAVRLGGDTDTTASVILGAALIRPGAQTLPEELIIGLENGPYGRDFLIAIGDQLSAKFPPDRIR
ncbi:MAG TPA: ADP-ribosylglycohydrolase family protein [Methanospirillum sp.]|nr:ADP-ribosylglycohydrolase family protein [Methanospirillum sp.]